MLIANVRSYSASIKSRRRSNPPNPTELLARDGLDKAIETLKKNFEYVILDTAPVGMVTDTFLIGRVADLSVYVCRADYTRKNEYTLINELIDGNKERLIARLPEIKDLPSPLTVEVTKITFLSFPSIN